MEAPLVLQHLRVLKLQLDFRTAASRGRADFESARSDGGRLRREGGLHVSDELANFSLATPVACMRHGTPAASVM